MRNGTFKAAFVLLLSTSPQISAQSTATSILMLQVGAACGVSVVSSTHSELVRTGVDSQYSGVIRFVYQIRTTRNTGSGKIQLEIVDDALLPGATLSYRTALTGIAVSVPDKQTSVLPSGAAIVATFASDQSSSKEGSGGEINWLLTGQASPLGRPIPPDLRLTIACH
jgi:hypothetical protein